MTKVTFDMVKNDLKPSILCTLKYADGSLVDLTSCSVKFHMKKGSTLLVDKSAVVVSPPTGGVVRYDWTTGDTNVVIDSDGYGSYDGEFEVTFADTKTMTFPSKKGDFEIRFRDQLG